MACHELANRSPKCASATSAYRAGYEGRQMGQGASLATTADPLAQRQNDRRPTSDGKCWQENFRGGRRNLGHTGKEGNGSEHTTAKGISTSAASACLHPEVKRQDAPSGYSHDEGPRDAGIVPARSRSRRGNHGGSELLWVPAAAVLRRCVKAVLQRAEERESAVDL